MGRHFGATPFLIAGPCVVESDALNLRIGEALAELGTKLGVHVIYKASYDKANRSRLKGARGPGLERGLQALATVRSETGLPILTDVHDAAQVAAAAQVADVLQIPAFLCRQTDLLVAAGRAGRAVNVKKGQWLSPDGMQGAVEKVRAGPRRWRSPSAAHSSATAIWWWTCGPSPACEQPAASRSSTTPPTRCSSRARARAARAAACGSSSRRSCTRPPPPARTGSSSRRTPIPTALRPTDRTCCRSTSYPR